MSSHPTSSMRSVQALRQTTGMMRMYWAMIGGSNRFVFVLSLSVLPTKTCSTQTVSKLKKDTCELCLRFCRNKSSNLVSPLAFHSVSRVRAPIKAARHLEGFDILSRAHSTGSLSDDACQTHLLLHIYLLSTSQVLVSFTAFIGQPHDFKVSTRLTSIQGFLSWAADVQALTIPWLLSRANSGPQR